MYIIINPSNKLVTSTHTTLDSAKKALAKTFKGSMSAILKIESERNFKKGDTFRYSDTHWYDLKDGLEVELANTPAKQPTKGNAMKNINKQALKLAHSIKAAYSSFRVALLVAYKVLKDSHAKQQVLNGLSTAQLKLSALGNQKWVSCFNAWVAIWNLDYLD